MLAWFRTAIAAAGSLAAASALAADFKSGAESAEGRPRDVGGLRPRRGDPR
jgi:hypothetical protein